MKNIWQSFNPLLKDKMSDNPKITLLGLFWAGYWRFYVLITVVGCVVLGVCVVIAKILF